MSSVRSVRVWSLGVSAAILAGIGLAPVLYSQMQPPPAAGGPVAAVNLENEMKAMGTAFRTIRTQVTDKTKNGSTIELLSQMETHVINAKGATPPGAATQPAASREAYVADFRKGLIGVERECLDAESALLDNDNDKAAKSVAEMAQSESAGHAEYRPKGS